MLVEGAEAVDVSTTFVWIGIDSPKMEETAHEGRDRGLKKSRSNDDERSGPVEAELGIWKDWSKSNHVGVVDVESESVTAYRRPSSIPLGRFG